MRLAILCERLLMKIALDEASLCRQSTSRWILTIASAAKASLLKAQPIGIATLRHVFCVWPPWWPNRSTPYPAIGYRYTYRTYVSQVSQGIALDFPPPPQFTLSQQKGGGGEGVSQLKLPPGGYRAIGGHRSYCIANRGLWATDKQWRQRSTNPYSRSSVLNSDEHFKFNSDKHQAAKRMPES